MNLEVCRAAFELDLTSHGATPEHLRYQPYSNFYWNSDAEYRWGLWQTAWKAALISEGLEDEEEIGR